MATLLSRISWEPIYSVHIESLDDQHKKLFEAVNRLINLYEDQFGDFLPVLKDLIDYLSVHFREEHTIMNNANYPNFLSHRNEHLKFTEKIEDFLKGYKEGDKKLGFNMLVFLKDWVSNHTKTLDVQYGQYLLKHPPQLKQPPK
jgi:hemerythrin